MRRTILSDVTLLALHQKWQYFFRGVGGPPEVLSELVAAKIVIHFSGVWDAMKELGGPLAKKAGTGVSEHLAQLDFSGSEQQCKSRHSRMTPHCLRFRMFLRNSQEAKAEHKFSAIFPHQDFCCNKKFKSNLQTQETYQLAPEFCKSENEKKF